MRAGGISFKPIFGGSPPKMGFTIFLLTHAGSDSQSLEHFLHPLRSPGVQVGAGNLFIDLFQRIANEKGFKYFPGN